MKLGAPRLPHTLVLIYAMVVLTVIATWVVPGGEYQRVEKDGRSVPVDGTFRFAARQPQGLGALFMSPARGFVEAAAIIVFVFIMGGVFGVVEKTGAVSAGIQA
ncbi:MAG: YfcC family protein, partial [Candidatus Aminicenantes bacterium]|nr:YfcC family protein [Candidatus Aminicenantes bacterium]